jgi:hypothetical protein
VKYLLLYFGVYCVICLFL